MVTNTSLIFCFRAPGHRSRRTPLAMARCVLQNTEARRADACLGWGRATHPPSVDSGARPGRSALRSTSVTLGCQAARAREGFQDVFFYGMQITCRTGRMRSTPLPKVASGTSG